MQILGVANSYASAPVNAPTSLSAVPSTTSVAISFTAPTNDGGATITNYQYNINGGSFIALSPADATSPITISGLAAGTSYTVTLKAVNIVGAGPASAGLSFSTSAQLEFFVVGGGGGGGAGFNNGQVAGAGGSGGGGGGSQTGVLQSIPGTYTITVGGRGSAGGYPAPPGGTGGTSSVTNPSSASVVSAAGGGGGASNTYPPGYGYGGSGTSWTGRSGNNVAGITNGWTGTNVVYSSSGIAGGGGGVQGDTVGRGGNGGGGNPSGGVPGGTGHVHVRIPSGQAAKITSVTGTVNSFTASGYTFYRWTTSGTMVIS